MDDPQENTLHYKHIWDHQQASTQLIDRRAKYSDRYVDILLDNNVNVVGYIKTGDDPAGQWKTALLEAKLDDTIH